MLLFANKKNSPLTTGIDWGTMSAHYVHDGVVYVTCQSAAVNILLITIDPQTTSPLLRLSLLYHTILIARAVVSEDGH